MRRITTKSMMDAIGKKDIIESVEEIEGLIRRFEKQVWFGQKNLQSIANKWDTWGHEANMGNMKVLFGGSAGRLLITFYMNNDEDMLTLIADESGGGGCGIQGIDTTKEIAIEMLLKFICAWKPFHKQNLEIKESEHIMIM